MKERNWIVDKCAAPEDRKTNTVHITHGLIPFLSFIFSIYFFNLLTNKNVQKFKKLVCTGKK